MAMNTRVFKMAFASVYPHYVAKVEKKGHTKEELHVIIHWLTGYDERALQQQIAKKVDFETFFAQAPRIHPNVTKITGMICGYRIEEIEDPLMRQIRYLATTADITGTLQSKTSWAVSFTPAPAPATTGSIMDGSTTTYSRWTASPVQVDLDMQASKNVTGFRMYTSTTSTVSPTQVEVWTSDDGINYKLTGSPLRANLTYASGYTYVGFYKPIAARYLRLKAYYSTSTSSQNFRIAELDVYAN